MGCMPASVVWKVASAKNQQDRSLWQPHAICACADRLQRGMAARGFAAIDIRSDAAPHHSKSRINQIRSARSTLEVTEADMLHAGCQRLPNIGDTSLCEACEDVHTKFMGEAAASQPCRSADGCSKCFTAAHDSCLRLWPALLRRRVHDQ